MLVWLARRGTNHRLRRALRASGWLPTPRDPRRGSDFAAPEAEPLSPIPVTVSAGVADPTERTDDRMLYAQAGARPAT
jgi:hypothetical protein